MDRKTPPQTPDLPVFKLPSVFETRLDNGLDVLLVEDHRFPLVTLRLGFQAGAKFDPRDLPGVSEMTAALLTEGTESRTSRQIAEEAAGIGGAVSGSSSADALVIGGNSLAEHLDKLLGLVADVARNANFPEDEVALRKDNRKQELLAQLSQASFLADEKMHEVVFGEHPYSRQEPTLESIEAIGRETIAGFRDAHLAPNNAALIILGALPSREAALEMIRREFGSWAPGEPPAAPQTRFPESKRTIALVDRPGSVQADIRIARLAVDRAHLDYFPLFVGNTILGGGASSRIFTNIREKHGFAYDAGSMLRPMRDRGLFAVVTQVRNEVVERAIHAALAEMEAIATAEVTHDELTTAKNYISGTFVIRLETQDGLASQIAATKLLGLPLEYLETYTARVRAVTPEEIKAAARKYLAPDRASLVVVGDVSAIGEQLEKFGNVAVEKAR